MLQNVLSKICADLSNLRPKFLFGYFGKKEKETIFSYLKEEIAMLIPNVAFLTPEEYKSSVSSFSASPCCFLLEEAFSRKDIAPLINLAYGNKNLLLIGFSSSDIGFLSPDVLTTIAARYDSYFLAPRIPPGFDSDYVSFLMKGGLSLSKEAYVDDVLSQIIKKRDTRKKQEVRDLIEFLICHAGESFSVRSLAASFNSFAPNVLGKYLEEFCQSYLFYRLDGYDFSAEKAPGGNFRVIPYDTSLYSFSRRDALRNIDLLALTPILGRAKEEGYDCHWGYFHRKKKQEDSSRKYRDEDVGLLVSSPRRKMIFALDLSGEGKTAPALSDVSQTIEKYRVVSGDSSPFYGKEGVCHVSIVYLLGDGFDWRKR